MGKEVKVGLAVLLILLVTFGVVLARRLTSNRDEGPMAAAASETSSASQSGGRAEEPEPSQSRAATTAMRPTLVAPREVPVQGPPTSPPAVERWTVPSDESAGAAGEAAAASDPPMPGPSYMPRPPHARPSDPHDRYGAGYADPPSRSTWPPTTGSSDGGAAWPPAARAADPADAAPGGSAASYDPFHGRSAPGNLQPVAAPDYRAAPPMPQPPRPGDPYSTGADAGSPSRTWAGAGAGYQSSPSSGHYGGYAGGSGYGPAPEAGRLAATAASRLGAAAGRRDDGTYVVQPNDNYWVISEKLYGSGAYFKALAEHNRGKVRHEDRLAVGEVISAPELSALETEYPNLCPKPERREAQRSQTTAVSMPRPYAAGRTYTVEEGDTLFSIARHELGRQSRWVEIYELNRHVIGEDYNYVRPGLRLVMPDDGAAGPVTQRTGPEMAYPR